MYFTSSRAHIFDLELGLMEIGVIAPSDWFFRDLLDEGIQIIEDHGHEVILSKNATKRVKDFMAGDIDQRLEDIEEMANSDVKVIWTAEGGYAATEIRYGLEGYRKKLENKLLIGYSDITNLHLAWRSWGGLGLYASTVCELSRWSTESTQKLFELLDSPMITALTYTGGIGVVPGQASGIMVAGNLETMSMCAGTIYDPFLASLGSVILGLEEYKQELSIINRQLDQIFDSREIYRLTGVVLGRFCQLSELGYPEWAEGISVAELVSSKLARRGIEIPVWQFDGWGHETATAEREDFYPIVNGSKSWLRVADGQGKLEMRWS